MIRAIVTDIEGTTTSLAFVHEELFPYSRARLIPFLESNQENPEVRAALEEAASTIESETGFLPDAETIISRLLSWIDADRKHPALKKLQGMIWEEGYRAGVLKGHVYSDVPPVLKKWAEEGIQLAVYSSGSVQAQKLLFGHTAAGDLTPLFSYFFDTGVGAKAEIASYRHIQEQMGIAPEQILFLSDAEKELNAAREAGLRTCQVLREGVTPTDLHPQAAEFYMADKFFVERTEPSSV